MQEKIQQSAYYGLAMRGSRKFCQRESNSDVVFLFLFLFFCFFSDEGREDPNTNVPLKAGHYLLASKTPFKWRFYGRPMMVQH